MKKSIRLIKKIIPIAILILLICSLAYSQESKKAITEEEAKAIMNGYLKFRNEGDLAAADEVIHPDCVIHYPNFPEPMKGLDALKEYDRNNRIAFPDCKLTIDDFFVKDDKIYAYWTFTATNTGPLVGPMVELPPTNKKVLISGFAITHVADGKIIKDVSYFDTLNLMMQLGFTIVPPQPPKKE